MAQGNAHIRAIQAAKGDPRNKAEAIAKIKVETQVAIIEALEADKHGY